MASRTKSRTSASAQAAVLTRMHDTAYAQSIEYLEQFAGRKATADECRRLVIDAEGQFPPQELLYGKVRKFLHEVDLRRGWAVEGFLRISAPTYAVRGLWALIPAPDFSLVRVENVHIIAATFKMYLREQKQPVLYRQLFGQIVECVKNADDGAQRAGLRYVVSLLDPLRRLVLHDICRFGQKILSHARHNKMDADNVSICLSPSIIEPDTNDPLKIAQTAGLSRAAFALLLMDVDYFFPAAQVARDAEVVACPPDPVPSAFAWVRLTEQEWDTLLSSARLSTYQSGDVVVSESQAVQSVFRLQSGSCALSLSGSPMGDLVALDVFGLASSLWTGFRNEGTVVASAANTRIYALPVGALENALVIDTSLAFKWYCTVSVGLALRVSHLSRLEVAAESAAATNKARGLQPSLSKATLLSDGDRIVLRTQSFTTLPPKSSGAMGGGNLSSSSHGNLSFALGATGGGVGSPGGATDSPGRSRSGSEFGGAAGSGGAGGLLSPLLAAVGSSPSARRHSRGVAAAAAAKHSSTSTYSLKSYAAKWLDVQTPSPQQPRSTGGSAGSSSGGGGGANGGKKRGVLALTSTHLAFEREKPSGKAQQPAAIFVPFEGITSVELAIERGPAAVQVSHATLGASVFVLEDDTAARDVRDTMGRVLAAMHARRTRDAGGGSAPGSPGTGAAAAAAVAAAASDDPLAPLFLPGAVATGRRALCIKAYQVTTAYHLRLNECDTVVLIKDDPKEELWYGEANGKEGYFVKSHVAAVPQGLPAALQPLPAHWAVLEKHAQVLTFARGDMVCASGDHSTIGFLFIVRDGIVTQLQHADAPPDSAFYVGEHGVFGELGVLIGAPQSFQISAFSERVTVLRLDCRDGSALSQLLASDLALAIRLFRFVAGVCAMRVDAMVKRLAELRAKKEIMRQRISSAASGRKKPRAKKIEFDDDGLVLVGDDADGAASEVDGAASATAAKARRRKSKRSSVAPVIVPEPDEGPARSAALTRSSAANDASRRFSLNLAAIGAAGNAPPPSKGISDLFSMMSPAARSVPRGERSPDSLTSSNSLTSSSRSGSDDEAAQ